MKIQIIGFSGSGKSTLAQKLGELYNIPVLHLDNTKFYGNMQVRNLDEQTKIVKQFLDNNENWVIDGNYAKVCPERFEMTDMTVFLKLNRFVCYHAASKRAKMRKKVKDESFLCDDKFGISFRFWVLFKGRTRKRIKLIMELLNKTKGKKFILKNRKQVNNFIESLILEKDNKSN